MWRLENGELPTARQPKVVVVQIGTNGARLLWLLPPPLLRPACLHVPQHPWRCQMPPIGAWLLMIMALTDTPAWRTT